jgi:hypothetical protein
MTPRALKLLQDKRQAIDAATAKREDAISGLVHWISSTHRASGRSLVELIREAGLSRQTYYKRQATGTNQGATQDFHALRKSYTEAESELETLRKERQELVADAADPTAEEVARAAGVTATWVRVLRRQLANEGTEAGAQRPDTQHS